MLILCSQTLYFVCGKTGVHCCGSGCGLVQFTKLSSCFNINNNKKKGFREIFIVLIESQPAMLFNSKMTILCSLCYCCFPLNFPLGMNKVANIVIDGINKHHHKKVQYSTVFCDITVGYSFISCGCKTVKPISKTLFIKHIRQMIH